MRSGYYLVLDSAAVMWATDCRERAIERLNSWRKVRYEYGSNAMVRPRAVIGIIKVKMKPAKRVDVRKRRTRKAKP